MYFVPRTNLHYYAILIIPWLAIKDGQCKIGLSLAELEDLARAGSSNRARKCSTRELATVLCRTTTTTMTNANANEEKGTTAQWGATTGKFNPTLWRR